MNTITAAARLAGSREPMHDHVDVVGPPPKRLNHQLDGADVPPDGTVGPLQHRSNEEGEVSDGHSRPIDAKREVGDRWLQHRLREAHPRQTQTLEEGYRRAQALNTGRQDPFAKGAHPTDPAWLKTAFGELDVREGKKAATNPRIIEYFEHTYRKGLHSEDSGKQNAWCAAFVTFTFAESGVKTGKAVGAREYESWGEASDPFRGAVVVLRKGTQKHVAFLAGVDHQGRNVYLGGNQDDAVSLSTLDGYEILAVRKPKGHQPSPALASLPRVAVTANGSVSTR